jgi:large subunit ribosomal protein L10
MLEGHKTIGIVQMESIGAGTVQKLRSDLLDRASIVVAKNTLMKKALEQTRISGSDKLNDYIKGPAAFLFTNNSPYQIANYLDKNKVRAPAKSGQISPIAVTIPKMNTGFPPGTIISELNSVGLQTRIEGGTVAIPQDTQVLEPGDRISTTLASILTRLGIEPFLVGLSLDVVLENGDLIPHDDLIVDFDEYRNQIIFAYQSAISLSVYAGIITSDTAPIVLASAKQNAIALAAAIGYITKETAPMVLGRANAQALSVLRAVVNIDNDAVPQELAKLVN